MPYWEANNCSPTQDLTSISWNPKFHYRVHHNSPLLVPILSQINPVHTHAFYSFQIHFNIILHICLGLPGGLFSSGFPSKALYWLAFSRMRATCPASVILVDLIILVNRPTGRVETVKFLITQFLPASYYSISLRSKYSPQHTVLKHPRSMFFP
jgi:hypothetical protein